MINLWGNKLLTPSRDELVKAIIDGAKVRLIFDTKCRAVEKSIPNAIEKKFAKITTNIFVFDNYNILILDNSGTMSALIQSNEIFLSTIMNQFEALWNVSEKITFEQDNKIKFISNN
jgi:hypothetical protein